jgi:hypothetical protein
MWLLLLVFLHGLEQRDQRYPRVMRMTTAGAGTELHRLTEASLQYNER